MKEFSMPKGPATISRALAVVTVLAATGALATAPAATAATTAPAATAAAATNVYGYVSMGDSLSAGEGTYQPYDRNTDTSANRCHRSPNSYSALYASHDPVISYKRINVACSGANAKAITSFSNPNSGGKPDAGDQPQVNALNGSTRLVTISLGINDLNLIGFAMGCYLQTTLKGANRCFLGIPYSTAYQFDLKQLAGILNRTYNTIRAKAKNATVAVLDYPQTYPAKYTGGCEVFLTGIRTSDSLVTSPAMLKTVSALIHTLDTKIADVVATHRDFILVNEEHALDGHDMCASDPWVNHVVISNLFSRQADQESLHPTVRGYQAMARVLAARLDAGHWPLLDHSGDQGNEDKGIQKAYVADGGLASLGYPADNGGGPYVHRWDIAGAVVQDFSGGAFGPAIMVDGPQGTYFVNHGFRTAYINGGWAKTCKAPIDLAHNYGTRGTRQDFVGCYMTWDRAAGVLVHGLSAPACTNYGSTFISGPNACAGFYTAPAPGKPASADIWYPGGGAGLDRKEIWTYGSGTTATSTAHYTLSGLGTAHAYMLQAYIPSSHSDASHAHYHFCSAGGGCGDGYVNQQNFTNAWVSLGAVCTTDGTVTITLADDGGDTYPAEIGADAIRAVRTGVACR